MVPVLASLALFSLLACPPATPLPGTVVRSFAPIRPYAGHWGVDIATPVGGAVVSVGGGIVSFAGSVAGRQTVTIRDVDGVQVSYSYLASISVAKGENVKTGTRLGTSGQHGGVPAFHLSLRIDGEYRDPMILFQCLGPPGLGLWLAPRQTLRASPYAQRRVRNTRWHVRPATHRPSRRCPRGP